MDFYLKTGTPISDKGFSCHISYLITCLGSGLLDDICLDLTLIISTCIFFHCIVPELDRID